MIYAAVVPPWQAPDEPAQFERAKAALSVVDWNSTSENGPLWYEELIKSLFVFNLWDFLDAVRPIYTPGGPLNSYIVPYHEAYNGLYSSRPPYMLIGWPLFIAEDQDITLQLYLVRLNTILMNVGIILLAYLTVRLLFPKDKFLYLGVPLLILFNPQHTHLLSTVNNGNLAELLTVAALYFMVRGFIKGFFWFNISAVLVLSIVAMWTKATAYFLPIILGTAGLFYLWRYRRHWWWILPVGSIGAILAYFLMPARLKLLLSWGWEGFRSGAFYLDPIVPLDLFRSFWALPGWFTLPLDPIWYWLLAVGCVLALTGLLGLLVKERRLLVDPQQQPRLQALLVLAVAVVAAIGILLAWNAISHSTVYRQGRSIYPVIVPIYLFLMLGWRQFIPRSWRKEGLIVIVTLFCLFDLLVLFHYIFPFFYSRY